MPILLDTFLLPNATAITSAVGSAPAYRDKFNIVSTCLSTLLICVWTVVHVDIPPTPQPWYLVLLEKIWWLVVGIIAPDFLLYLATAEFIIAVHILRDAHWYLRFQSHSDGPGDNEEGDTRKYKASWFIKLIRKKVSLCILP